jgi:predicted N-acetyltransferase YhbS
MSRLEDVTEVVKWFCLKELEVRNNLEEPGVGRRVATKCILKDRLFYVLASSG